MHLLAAAARPRLRALAARGALLDLRRDARGSRSRASAAGPGTSASTTTAPRWSRCARSAPSGRRRKEEAEKRKQEAEADGTTAETNGKPKTRQGRPQEGADDDHADEAREGPIGDLRRRGQVAIPHRLLLTRRPGGDACSSPSRESTAPARAPRPGCSPRRSARRPLLLREPGGTAGRRAAARAAQGRERRADAASRAAALLRRPRRARRARDPAGARGRARRRLRPLRRLDRRLPGRCAGLDAGPGRDAQRGRRRRLHARPHGAAAGRHRRGRRAGAAGAARRRSPTASNREGVALPGADRRRLRRGSPPPSRSGSSPSTPTGSVARGPRAGCIEALGL